MKSILIIVGLFSLIASGPAFAAGHECGKWGKAQKCHGVWDSKSRSCVCRG